MRTNLLIKLLTSLTSWIAAFKTFQIYDYIISKATGGILFCLIKCISLSKCGEYGVEIIPHFK